MDALALLCNLYGDGPATLKRLRSAGCATFEDLERIDAPQLAGILGSNEAAARRFLREARVLVDRVGAQGLDDEERSPLAASPAPVEVEEPRSALPEPDPTSPESFGEEEQPGAEAAIGFGAGIDDEFTESGDETPDPLVDRVLETWRERDAAGTGTGGFEHDVEFSPANEAWPAAESAAQGQALGTALRPRIVDGLGLGWCERLRAHGITTLEELVAAETMDVARSIGAGLTQVMRLQFLARRLMSERGEAETPEPPDMLRPMARPMSQPGTQPGTGSGPSPALPRPSRPGGLQRPDPELLTGPHPRSESMRARPIPSEPPRSADPQPRVARPTGDLSAPQAVKFSLSEAPFGVATSALARDLDAAGNAIEGRESSVRPSDVAPPRSGLASYEEDGPGGPFA